MLEENPEKIKKAEIAVAIPSYNEANSIGRVVEIADEGLNKFFAGKKAVIINADNNSQDNTKGAFFKTKTNSPKIYLSTPEGVKGKGNNVYNIFLKTKELGVSACMLIDADMKSANIDWVNCLIEPVLEKYDYISPFYYRDKCDGSITNNLCYPLVYGLLGCDIRQPIGGEVGFSAKMIEFWLNQKWPEEAKLFGIDIFMCFFAILSGYKIGVADLGIRAHKPSLPKLDFMFYEVASTFFELLAEHKEFWQKELDIKKPPLVCSSQNSQALPETDLDAESLKEKSLAHFEEYYNLFKKDLDKTLQRHLEKVYLKEETAAIDSQLWTEVVYQIFALYQKTPDRKKIIKLLRALYFARLATFVQATANKTQEQAEELIKEQAKLFSQRREILLK